MKKIIFIKITLKLMRNFSISTYCKLIQVVLISSLFFTANIYAQDVLIIPFGKKVISNKDSVRIEQLFLYQKDFYSQFASTQDTLEPKIIIFKDKNALHNHMKFVGKEPNNETIGTFISKRREMLVACSDQEITKSVSYQISNYFVFLTLKYLHSSKSSSNWIHSGLDEYFRNTSFTKKGIQHEPPVWQAKRGALILIRAKNDEFKRVRGRDLSEIKDESFAEIGGEDFLKEFVGLNKDAITRLQSNYSPYTRSLTHSLVYFLVEQHKYQFLQIVAKVENGTSSYDAINEIYSGGFDQFEKDFITFCWL